MAKVLLGMLGIIKMLYDNNPYAYLGDAGRDRIWVWICAGTLISNAIQMSKSITTNRLEVKDKFIYIHI